MRIGIGQIFVLLMISFLLFGDVQGLKSKMEDLFKKTKIFLKEKNRKKGT